MTQETTTANSNTLPQILKELPQIFDRSLKFLQILYRKISNVASENYQL